MTAVDCKTFLLLSVIADQPKKDVPEKKVETKNGKTSVEKQSNSEYGTAVEINEK